jgi:hypothetical protein
MHVITRTYCAKKFRDEDGSAILEFIVLALPLFVPLLWFISTATHYSMTNYDLATYSRNLVRAFISTPSPEYLTSRLDSVSQEFRETLFSRDHLQSFPTYEISCNESDCLSAGARVQVNVNYLPIGSENSLTSTSVGYVDKWGGS